MFYPFLSSFAISRNGSDMPFPKFDETISKRMFENNVMCLLEKYAHLSDLSRSMASFAVAFALMDFYVSHIRLGTNVIYSRR
jgi:hypothetical protein